MNLIVALSYITGALGIVLPGIFCVVGDKKYEDWKKQNGYVNYSKKKGIFRDFKGISNLEKIFGYISFLIPGINLIPTYIILYRRYYGITLDEELKNGDVYQEINDVIVDNDILDDNNIDPELLKEFINYFLLRIAYIKFYNSQKRMSEDGYQFDEVIPVDVKVIDNKELPTNVLDSNSCGPKL